jgi:hypothetical protein
MVIAAIAFTSQSTFAWDEPPAGMAEIPEWWIVDFRAEIDNQVQRFASAYEMSEDAQNKMRETLMSRMPAQWSFEQAGFAQIEALSKQLEASGADENSPDAVALSQKMLDLQNAGPMSDMAVAQEIETTLPPESASVGRIRLQELLTRRDQMMIAQDSDLDMQASGNAVLVDGRLGSMAHVSDQSNPLPQAPKQEEIADDAAMRARGEPGFQPVREPAGAAVNTEELVRTATDEHRKIALEGAIEAEAKAASEARAEAHDKAAASERRAFTEDASKRHVEAKQAFERAATAQKGMPDAPPERAATPSRRGASSGQPTTVAPVQPVTKIEPVKLAPAPPIDDWDKHVDATSTKYGFTDAQRTKAQSILRDLRHRAEQYRASRDADFKSLGGMADRKAQDDRKKQLNQPLDAMFDELKQRLDNLATLEQRSKAQDDKKPAVRK